jgi:hypothetical protein
MRTNSTLQAPPRPQDLPEQAQWLAGIGAGSWFYICKKELEFEISRFGPEGNIECRSFFEIEGNAFFELTQLYTFTYLSHCKSVRIQQGNSIIKFHRKQVG